MAIESCLCGPAVTPGPCLPLHPSSSLLSCLSPALTFSLAALAMRKGLGGWGEGSIGGMAGDWPLPAGPEV